MPQQILDNLNIDALNPMQLACIEASKTKGDIIILSPTGSGKTLAFLIPILESLTEKNTEVKALVVVPSRELALQIEQVWKQMNTGYKVSCCYGGHAMRVEKNNLSQAPALLIGTPGRIAHHIRNNNFNPSFVNTLVLDEFDKSLELGFQDEMGFIISNLNHLQKRVLTSATDLKKIPGFTGIRNPKKLDFLQKLSPTKNTLKLKSLRTEGSDKLHLLFELICHLQGKPCLIFCNHRDAVDRISALLKYKGVAHGVFHGGMNQEERERALIKFRNGSFAVLISTDLASRGLDIPEIEAVVHYQLPVVPDVFTHRNGRTARMNAEGTAWLLFSGEDTMPAYIDEVPEHVILSQKATLPPKASWQTLYFSVGKKDKVNKMDIVGMLLQKGGLAKEELGLVEVLDFASFAAIHSDKIVSLLAAVEAEKIKGKKVKMEIAR